MNIARLGGLGVTAAQNRSKSAVESTNKRLNEALEKLATGSRINRASDDAAGLSLSEQLNTQIRGFKMADKNIHNAMAALDIADGASGEVTSLVQRQRDLANQARNGTVNDEQRAILNKEFQQLSKEISRIAEGTEYNKQKLANGSDLGSGTAKVHSSSDDSEGTGLPRIDLRTETLGIAGADISSIKGAEAAMKTMDVALESIGLQRSGIGSVSNRLTSTSNNLNTATVNSEAAESMIRDQDMALGIAELTRLQILERGGTQAFSMFNKISGDHVSGLLK